MIGAVYKICTEGGQLLCQAPTGIGKTMSVLFPALKAVGQGGPVFYLTARGTTRAAAENALALLRASDAHLKLRSVTLTAKDKICMQDRRECTPEACPYAKGYYDRVRTALWDALDTHALTADALQMLARRHKVCPFELGLDLSLWCDVVIGDYNYLFDPVVHLERFFDTAGDYLFLLDEAHNLPDRARGMHSAVLAKSAFYDAKKRLGKGKSSLKNALTKVNDIFIEWRHRCEEAPGDSRFGRTFFEKSRADALDRALTRLCEPLEIWLDEHRDPDETHEALLQLYFDIRAWLRVADTFDDHFVLQISAHGSEVRAAMLCLDPSDFLAADFAKGRAAVLFSATLAPAGYYRDLCGLPDARAVALRSPFDTEHLGLPRQHPLQGPRGQHCQGRRPAGRDVRGEGRALSGVFPELQLFTAGVGGFHRPVPGPADPLSGKRHGRGKTRGVSGAVSEIRRQIAVGLCGAGRRFWRGRRSDGGEPHRCSYRQPGPAAGRPAAGAAARLL